MLSADRAALGKLIDQRGQHFGREAGGTTGLQRVAGGIGQDFGEEAHMRLRLPASGVVIEEGLTDRDYGSRAFTCRDPEGNLYCFGTYWPNAE